MNVNTTQPLEMLCIVILSLETSNGGFEKFLVMSDHFFKFAQAVPTRNQLVTTVAKIILLFTTVFPFVYTVTRGELFNQKLSENCVIFLE